MTESTNRGDSSSSGVVGRLGALTWPLLLVAALVALGSISLLALGGREAGAQTAAVPPEEVGSAVAWGYNAYGQTSVPAGANSGVKAIAGGDLHSLALKEDGSVIAWGDPGSGQTSVPAGAKSGVKAIAGGANHSLALKEDGSVVAWGDNYLGQRTVPASLNGVKSIAGGGYHSLALKDTTSPAAADSFVADAGDGEVSLSWSNPPASDFEQVRILRSTTAAATGPEPNATQTQVYEGSNELFTDTGLTNTTTYHYTIYAVDDAGNYSASASSSATPEDTTAPDTNITSGPTQDSTVASTDQAFSFTSTQSGSSFECSVDNGATYQSCSSGDTFTFTEGPNTFKVAAKDAAGNQDQTPDSRAFTVDTTAPTMTATTPSGRKVSPKANVTAKFSESMDETSVETLGVVKLVKKGTTRSVLAVVSYSDATSTVTLDPTRSLTKGATYTATVSTGAKDKAGNRLDQDPALTGDQPKQWSFKVRK